MLYVFVDRFAVTFDYQEHLFYISKIWAAVLRIWSAKTQLNQAITSTKKNLTNVYLSLEILLQSVVFVKERQIKLTQKGLCVSI